MVSHFSCIESFRRVEQLQIYQQGFLKLGQKLIPFRKVKNVLFDPEKMARALTEDF
jgi:hypothetical protein